MANSANVVHHIFGSDRPLLYDIEPWKHLGFAVPNFGNNYGTLSQPIWGLADEIGRAQLYVMTHIDAQRRQPPSRNTIERIGKLCNRIYAVLAGRRKEYKDLRLEEGHASSDLLAWSIHPVPFFGSSIMRNRWLMEYNRLVMVLLTNAYQHSDNNLALTVTKKFAADIWQYANEIKMLLGIDLLSLAPEVVQNESFLFTNEHYDAYAPEQFTLNFERLDTAGPIQSRATEDDIRPLFEGIPAPLIIPNLAQYPIGPGGIGTSGVETPEKAKAPGTGEGQDATGPAGATIGEPQV